MDLSQTRASIAFNFEPLGKLGEDLILPSDCISAHAASIVKDPKNPTLQVGDFVGHSVVLSGFSSILLRRSWGPLEPPFRHLLALVGLPFDFAVMDKGLDAVGSEIG